MTDFNGGQGQPGIDRSEHSSDIDAKRVVPYIWNSTTGAYERQTGGNDITAGYAVSDTDESSPSPRYYGFLNADGGYYLMKETNTSNVKSYRYSKGTSGYSAAWSNRAAETYDLFSVIF